MRKRMTWEHKRACISTVEEYASAKGITWTESSKRVLGDKNLYHKYKFQLKRHEKKIMNLTTKEQARNEARKHYISELYTIRQVLFEAKGQVDDLIRFAQTT